MSASTLSPAQLLAQRIARAADPLGLLAKALAELTVTQRAALAHAWPTFWARANQLPPAGPWRSWGLLTARRFGKTLALARYTNQEAEAGRAMRIGICAQTEDMAIEVQVQGESGLIASATPWFKPRWEATAKQLTWPNGAQAAVFTPEKPGNIRGPGVQLFWASELQSWPRAHREEAWHNATILASLGYSRMVWDATPKRRHPILRMLLDRAADEPGHHYVVRGLIEENSDNLGAGVIADLRKAMGGTQRGREELDGVFLDEDEGALWSDDDFKDHYRELPTRFTRRIFAVDPSFSGRKGTDQTGLVELGLGVDGRVYVVANHTKKFVPSEEWAPFVVKHYFADRCDCVVIERDRGADAPVALLRAHAKELGARVEVVARKVPTRHVAGVIYVKEVTSRSIGDKGARAEPAAAEYKRGRVSHVKDGAGLDALEDLMTTWVPEEKGDSPDALDALVHGIWELAELAEKEVDAAKAFEGIEKVAAKLQTSTRPAAAASSIAALLGKSEWGSRGL